MKLHHIALAALATLAGQAHAIDPATMNAAGTVKVYASGATALSAAIGGLFTQNCALNGSGNTTLTKYTTSVILPPSTQAFTSTIYACTLIAGNDFTLPAGTNVMFQKRDEGGSGMGVYPVANSAAIEYIDPTTCTGPAAGSGATPGAGTCTALTTKVSDGGMSDVEPAMFAAPSNTPAEFVGQSIASGTMTVKPIVQTIFGLAVTKKLYDKLQADQGLAAGVRPNVPKDAVSMMLRSGFPYDTQGWKLLLPNTVDGTQLSQVTICRRVNGSGTQTSANRFWLEYPSNSGVTMEPLAAGDSSTTSHGTAAGNLFVFEGASTSNVRSCLTSANGANGFAIGHVSLENAETADWKFVKISGQEPGKATAKIGQYAYVVESTCQYRNAISGNVLTFMSKFCDGAASPANLAALPAAVQNGVMTPPQNAACPGAAAPATTFCSAVTRNGNTAEFLSFY